MSFRRLHSLNAVIICHLVFLSTAGFGQTAQQQTAPQAQPASPAQAAPQRQPAPAPAQQTPPAQPPAQQNPFENVPTAPAQPAPTQPAPAPAPKAETPKPATPEQSLLRPQDIISDIEFRGARRVPSETMRALTFVKRGDRYDEEALHRDFMALWNTGRFDDIRVERELTDKGWIIRYILTERRVIRSIKYEGNKSVSQSEILDRFKDRKVGLSVESQYDPAKVQRAANVIKEYLAERGRQYATVTPDVRQIPPSSLEIVFKVDEGPKVKVGNIDIEGNSVFSDREVIRSMKNLKPIGIPYSIFLEDLFAKSYDSTKLEEDKERIRQFYMEHGYFMARTLDHKVTIRDVGGNGTHIPLLHPNKPGKRADISINVEEGRQYRLRKVQFVGVKLFRSTDFLSKQVFQMSDGDIFSTAKLRKGMENMRKLYGEFGYIDFVPEPDPEPVPGTNLIDLTFNVDEGKQFFVRRIDFSGNTTTRDKVIRRELLIDEGDMYNTRLWEVSILRLNQLGYFEQLKAEDAATVTRDPKSNTVDITLKVKERGKNSIQLNGGVSGIAGSFIGFEYATNNFLGLGETLSLQGQLGDRLRSATFGFTEPYLFDKPIQSGFTVYTTRFNYDQAREASILSGSNLIPLFTNLGTQNLLNYVSTGYGFTTFVSYPLKRSFARLTATYGFDTSDIKTLTDAANNYFSYIDFQGVGGPNALAGIKTSRITLAYNYNTVNHPITPTNGKTIYLSNGFAGSYLGGNVNEITPTLNFKMFHPGLRKGHVVGFNLLGQFITGYGGKVAPPFSRFYMGGENDIRGFDIWGISPIAWLPTSAAVNVLNSDGTQRTQTTIVNGVATQTPVTMTIPIYQLSFPGGDTKGVGNFEYRIPIFGPVILAAFFDVGINRITQASQLGLNPGRISQLNAEFPQASFTGRAIIAPHTQDLRSSTGLELQVMMPVVNAPFRFYWAYNPNLVRTYLQPPIVVDRSMFPNQATFVNAITTVGLPQPFFERHSTFRFSIGRTF